jgi:hypothetical protein
MTPHDGRWYYRLASEIDRMLELEDDRSPAGADRGDCQPRQLSEDLRHVWLQRRLRLLRPFPKLSQAWPHPTISSRSAGKRALERVHRGLNSPLVPKFPKRGIQSHEVISNATRGCQRPVLNRFEQNRP